MRLFLLPISTRRTLLYCQKRNLPDSIHPTWSDRLQSKAARTWSEWEKKESGWQKATVNYGNQLLRRIPYEEWGLKSVPPLSQRRRQAELNGSEKVEVVYPQSLIAAEQVPSVLRALATEREALHRSRLMWCLIGMPITAPVALVPLVPNLPFFYLVYRAWSHWRALAGGKHIQFLLKNNLITPTPSPVVDAVYTAPKAPLPSTPEPTTRSRPLTDSPPPGVSTSNPAGETMLLSQAEGKKMTQALDLPQLEVELERAIWQVEMAIKKRSGEVEAAAATTANSTQAQDEEKKSKWGS